MKEIGFSYGVFGKSLSEQANEQGYELKNDETFENIRKAINMCGFYVATTSQVNAMIKKLHKQVVENLVLLELDELKKLRQFGSVDTGDCGELCPFREGSYCNLYKVELISTTRCAQCNDYKD